MLRTLVNVNPVQEMRAFEEMFDRMFGTPTRPTNAPTTLPVDITEREGKLFVRAAVPGVEPSDLEVAIEENVLTIRGETRHEAQNGNEKVYRREVSYGAFARSIRLPDGLDLNLVDAEFKNGVVTISIPRMVEEKPKTLRVPIRTSEGQTPVIEANVQTTPSEENEPQS
jgi:HSP20 family protein